MPKINHIVLERWQSNGDDTSSKETENNNNDSTKAKKHAKRLHKKSNTFLAKYQAACNQSKSQISLTPSKPKHKHKSCRLKSKRKSMIVLRNHKRNQSEPEYMNHVDVNNPNDGSDDEDQKQGRTPKNDLIERRKTAMISRKDKQESTKTTANKGLKDEKIMPLTRQESLVEEKDSSFTNELTNELENDTKNSEIENESDSASEIKENEKEIEKESEMVNEKDEKDETNAYAKQDTEEVKQVKVLKTLVKKENWKKKLDEDEEKIISGDIIYNIILLFVLKIIENGYNGIESNILINLQIEFQKKMRQIKCLLTSTYGLWFFVPDKNNKCKCISDIWCEPPFCDIFKTEFHTTPDNNNNNNNTNKGKRSVYKKEQIVSLKNSSWDEYDVSKLLLSHDRAVKAEQQRKREEAKKKYQRKHLLKIGIGCSDSDNDKKDESDEEAIENRKEFERLMHKLMFDLNGGDSDDDDDDESDQYIHGLGDDDGDDNGYLSDDSSHSMLDSTLDSACTTHITLNIADYEQIGYMGIGSPNGGGDSVLEEKDEEWGDEIETDNVVIESFNQIKQVQLSNEQDKRTTTIETAIGNTESLQTDAVITTNMCTSAVVAVRDQSDEIKNKSDLLFNKKLDYFSSVLNILTDILRLSQDDAEHKNDYMTKFIVDKSLKFLGIKRNLGLAKYQRILSLCQVGTQQELPQIKSHAKLLLVQKNLERMGLKNENGMVGNGEINYNLYYYSKSKFIKLMVDQLSDIHDCINFNESLVNHVELPYYADELINSIVDVSRDIEEIDDSIQTITQLVVTFDKQWSADEQCRQIQGRMLEMELMSKSNKRDEEKEMKKQGEKEKNEDKKPIKKRKPSAQTLTRARAEKQIQTSPISKQRKERKEKKDKIEKKEKKEAKEKKEQDEVKRKSSRRSSTNIKANKKSSISAQGHAKLHSRSERNSICRTSSVNVTGRSLKVKKEKGKIGKNRRLSHDHANKSLRKMTKDKKEKKFAINKINKTEKTSIVNKIHKIHKTDKIEKKHKDKKETRDKKHKKEKISKREKINKKDKKIPLKRKSITANLELEIPKTIVKQEKDKASSPQILI